MDEDHSFSGPYDNSAAVIFLLKAKSASKSAVRYSDGRLTFLATRAPTGYLTNIKYMIL